LLKKYFILTLFYFLLILTDVISADQVSPLSIHETNQLIGKNLAVLEENHQRLTVEEAREAYQQGQFSNENKDALSFGIGVSPRWLIAEVHNPEEENITRRMVIENSWLDRVDIYILRDQRVINQYHLGDSYPFSERAIKHRFFAFDHDYAQGSSLIFIRVETPDPMLLPIFFGSLEDSAQRDMFNGYSYGLLYGIITALLLYNFILFIQLRLIRYLFYIIYLAMFILMNQSYTGHAYFMFWPEIPSWQHWMNPLLITLYSLSGITFTFLFLKTQQLFPRLFYNILYGSLVFLIIQVVFFSLNWQTATVIFAIGSVIFVSLFNLLITLLSFKSKPADVLIFLFANIATLIGSLITALTVFSVLPYNDFTYRAIEIGISVDVILLSIALAEQFRILQSEKLLAEQLARLDPLTGLFNRRAFYEQAQTVLYNAQRCLKKTSVIVLDIDNFKQINDTYGHSIGDEVIKKTAEIIKSMIRKGDIPVRWGGEEFVIVHPNDGEEAMLLAERLRKYIEKCELSTSLCSLTFTISLGIAQTSDTKGSIDQLIKEADLQMYRAKEQGRNQSCSQLN